MPNIINLIDVFNDSNLVFDIGLDELSCRLAEAVEAKQKIIISFKGINYCSTLFMNALIGPLYQKYGYDADNYIKLTDINDDILNSLIEKVKEKAVNSKMYEPIFDNALLMK